MGRLVALGVTQSSDTPNDIALFCARLGASRGRLVFYVLSECLIVTFLLSLIRAAGRRAKPRTVLPRSQPSSTGTSAPGDGSRAPSLLSTAPRYSPSDLLASSPLDRRMRRAWNPPDPARLARTNFGENEARGGFAEGPRIRRPRSAANQLGSSRRVDKSFRSPGSDTCRFPSERRG